MGQLQTASHVIWSIPFFSDFNEKEKAALLAVAMFRHVMPKEMLFRQDDFITHYYWVCSGAVQLFRETPDGHELTSAFASAGDMLFDDDALQSRKAHTSNARAIEETTLVAIPVSWVQDHMQSCDHLANKLIHTLAQRAQQAQIDAEHQATMSAAQLIGCFLQQLCVKHGFNPKGFDLPYSKSLIASHLGMELESFSRALPKLREMGVVVAGKHVTFENVEMLQSHVCSVCSVAEECRTKKIMQALKPDQAHIMN